MLLLFGCLNGERGMRWGTGTEGKRREEGNGKKSETLFSFSIFFFAERRPHALSLLSWFSFSFVSFSLSLPLSLLSASKTHISSNRLDLISFENPELEERAAPGTGTLFFVFAVHGRAMQ